MIPTLFLTIAVATLTNAQSNSAAPSSTSSYTFGPTTASPLVNTPQRGSEYWPGYVPLNQKKFNYDDLPYKIDTDASGRGPQAGYNICNATTAGENSLCQTVVINAINDMCFWGLQAPANVGDSEASAVAYCMDAEKYGTRPIPAGMIRGMQWLRTPEYIQITGKLNQTMLNLLPDDAGGELDPVGADYRGNPLGGLIYSTAFAQNGTFQQIQNWNNFLGGEQFCYRICLPDSNNAIHNCEHTYDRIGCAYNAPGSYDEGVFEECDADVGLPVGEYVGSNGQTSTWTQPPESLGPISTVPYTPVKPSSSNCVKPTSLNAAFAGAIQTASSVVSGPVPVQTSPPTLSAAQSAVQRAVSQSSASRIAGSSALILVTFIFALLI